jgi:ABC-type branched-subunit amino acid transport system ATPase component
VPYSGSIHFGDRDLRDMTAGKIARAGVVQCPETRELFGTMSVRENLELGGHLLSQNARARQLEMLFDLFPILASRQSQAARTLSGGEQQMLAIARALMMQPTLLILDEPTLGLAPVVVADLLRRLSTMTADGTAILLAEQRAAVALGIARRGVILSRGQVVRRGSAAELAADPMLADLMAGA